MAQCRQCLVSVEGAPKLVPSCQQAATDGIDTRVVDSIVKVHASEALGRVADRVLQLFGGWGYSKDLPIERFYREARMWRIVEGPNEVHRWAVARGSRTSAATGRPRSGTGATWYAL